MNLTKYIINKIIYPYIQYKKNNNIQKYIVEMKNIEKLSSHEILELQEKRLKKLLLHCINEVPYYQKFDYLESLINENPRKALETLPILSKQEFMENQSLFLKKNADTSNLIPNSTGGSTGVPMKFFIDRIAVEHYVAARWRGLGWHNIELGDPHVVLWGSPIELSKSKSIIHTLKERYTKNSILIPAYNLKKDKIHSYIKKINRFKPVYFYGYATALYTFAKLMLEHNLKLSCQLNGIVSTAEKLYSHQRETIEKAFNTKVINEYGARDGGIIAYECPMGNMHITSDTLVIEAINVDKTGKGELLITDLFNYSMPRLRYKITDIGILDNTVCSCHSNLPVIKEIIGRENEMFVTKSGNLLHGSYFNHFAKNLIGVKQFQIIQHSQELFTLKIVKNNKFNEREIQEFINHIKKSFSDASITVKYCDKIMPLKSGKFKYAIREFEI